MEDEKEEKEEEGYEKEAEEISLPVIWCAAFFFGHKHHSAFPLTALIPILQGSSFRNQLIIFFTMPSFV